MAMQFPRDDRPRPRLAWVGYVLAVVAGLVGAFFAYGFGLQISGRLLGILLALNGAAFCSIVAGALADRALRWAQRGRGAA